MRKLVNSGQQCPMTLPLANLDFGGSDNPFPKTGRSPKIVFHDVLWMLLFEDRFKTPVGSFFRA